MPFSSENVKKISEEFASKRNAAQLRADNERESLYAALPDVRKIDRRLSSLGLRIFGESMRGGDVAGRIAVIRAETEELVRERARLIKEKGLDADIGEPKYECAACSDTGYDKNGKMCGCMRRALVGAEFKSSGMAGLISSQDFDNFSLEYYADADRAKMENIFEKAKEFARDVSGGAYRNMLFMGTTGLGKTHLSSGIAKKVIEGGCSVVYESAQNVFADFEHERFFRAYGDKSPSKTDKYFECDLLIIDDLGTEVTNQFTVSCLYNLINSRMVAQKSMLISTNVGQKELLDRYSDRIVSRLLGEFGAYMFAGRDIRSAKLRKTLK